MTLGFYDADKALFLIAGKFPDRPSRSFKTARWRLLIIAHLIPTSIAKSGSDLPLGFQARWTQ
jgi:hypothetical protein